MQETTSAPNKWMVVRDLNGDGILHGGEKKAGAGCEPSEDDGSSEYYGDGGVYRLSGNTLTFTKGGKILTIEDYTNRQLGITLDDNPGDGGSCPSSGPGGGGSGGGTGSCPHPINPLFSFSFSLPSIIRSVIHYVGGTWSSGRGGGIPPIVLDLNINGVDFVSAYSNSHDTLHQKAA